ncbi:MAG: hypothetical protein JXL20_00375 [Deltaproteobacteria bacterium]|nr:hypothetical protein [Deltaproteobacteria bacterium]
MKFLTRITAFTVLAMAGFAHLCLYFARDVILRIYKQLGGGGDPQLPLPTQLSIQASDPFALFVFTILSFIVLIASELFMSKERHRYITQLICVLLWSAFVTFCLWAFLLPMHFPRLL